MGQTSLTSLYEFLCHPGVTRVTAFVQNCNLPFSVEEIRSMTKHCKYQQCKPQFLKPTGATLTNTDTKTVIYCFSNLFSMFRMPAYIHSDRGASSFMSAELTLCFTLDTLSHQYFNKRNTTWKLFKFERRSATGQAIPSWLSNADKVLLKQHVRHSKYEPLVDKVQLIKANPLYAHVRISQASCS